MRRYLEEKGLEDRFGQKSAQELLNEAESSKPPTENTYSNDPVYSEVDEKVFEYFEQLEDELYAEE